MSGVDLDVDNYTISELLGILELDDPTSEEIIDATNEYISRFSPSNENRPDLVVFFQEIQTRLLRYMNEFENGENGENNEYNTEDKQTDKWITKQVLSQDDPVQRDKITGRVQKIDVYDNNHMPMKREQIGINNTFEVPVAQDSLNPNLQNVTSRFIVLDSQFRQASGGSESMSTDYTLDLSESLTDVVTLSLYSIQIPYTWYKIDYIYGNTCFWVTNEGNTFKIFIEPGNYTASEFCITLTNSFKNIGFTYSTSPNPDIVRYNSNNGKLTLYLADWVDPSGNLIKGIIQYTDTFDSAKNPYYTFFDITGGKSCYESGTYPCSASASSGRTFDSTLGWLMGFNLPIQPVFSSNISITTPFTYSGGNTPQSVLNLIGTKYFTLVIDDFNQNRINNGLITITELSKNLPLPSYYNNSQPYICGLNIPSLPSILDINAIGNLSNITQEEAVSMGVNPSNLFNTLQDKLDIGSGNVQQVLPSAPRTLTQAQIYTVNEIIKNRSKTISFRSKAPTNADTFGIIPLKYASLTTGQLYSELSGQFQDNKRIYFGPVDIDRLRVTLLDDRGNVVDLHGADWSVTLISENLYQY